MTVENTNPIQHFTANGETTVFAFEFAVEGKDNIKVTVNGTEVTVNDYSYNAASNAVVFNTAPEDGSEVVIERVTSLDRSINYQTYDNSFRPETLNYDLDRIWRVLQEQNIVDAELLARLKDEIEWRREHDEQVFANIDSETNQRLLVDERIREEIEQEVEARRTLDLNYDTLAQVRDLQVFGALKQYLDTIIASTSPNVFGGVTAGVVFALDQKSVQTHLEDIYDKLIQDRAEIGVKANQEYVDQQISLKANKVDVYSKTETFNKAESYSLLAPKADRTYVDTALTALNNGSFKAYPTLAEANLDIANIAMNTKVEVLEATNGGSYYKATSDATSLTKSAYDPQTASVTTALNKVEDSLPLKPTAAKVEVLSGKSFYPILPVVAGGFTVAMAAPFDSGVEVRTNGFTYLNKGDIVEVPTGYKVSVGCYATENNTSFLKGAVYKAKYICPMDAYCRFTFKRDDADTSITNLTVIDFLKITRSAALSNAFIKTNTLPFYKIDTTATSINSFELEQGGINGSTGENNEVITDVIYRSDFIKVNDGDTIKKTNADYVLYAYCYNENYGFIKNIHIAYIDAEVPLNFKGYIRLNTRREDSTPLETKTCTWCELKPKNNLLNDLKINFDQLSPSIQVRLLAEKGSSTYEMLPGTIDGSTGVQGTALGSSYVHHTNYIAVEIGDTFELTDPTFLYSPFWYDENKIFISSTNGVWYASDKIVTSQVNGYVCFTTKKSDNSSDILNESNVQWIKHNKINSDITPDIDSADQIASGVIQKRHLGFNLSTLSQWEGKKWLSLGDSITARGWYQPLVVEKLGLSSYTNYGLSGSTLARKTTSDTTSMSVRYANMDAAADLITVWGGVNDFGYAYGSNGGTEIGQMGDTSIDTVYGATKAIIEGLTTKYPLAKVAFIITPPVSNSMGMRSANKKGYRLEQYCQAIREVCEYYSIPYIDLYKTSGINEKNVNIMTSNIAGTTADGLHPSRLAMEHIAHKLSSFLRDL